MASAGDSVASFLNAAVNRAERRQQPVEVVIFPQKGDLLCTPTSPASRAN